MYEPSALVHPSYLWHTYRHTHINTHTHIYIRIYIHTYTYTHTTYVCMNNIYTRIRNMYTHVYTYTNLKIHIYAHTFNEIAFCLRHPRTCNTHKHTHTHIHTHTYASSWAHLCKVLQNKKTVTFQEKSTRKKPLTCGWWARVWWCFLGCIFFYLI